jgi:hypothetical protein
VRLYNCPNEPKAQSVTWQRSALVSTVETVKDAWLVAFGYSNSSVFYDKDSLTGLRLNTNGYRTVRWRIFDCVVKQVCYNPLQTGSIPDDHKWRFGLHAQRELAIFGRRLKKVACFAHQS